MTEETSVRVPTKLLDDYRKKYTKYKGLSNADLAEIMLREALDK